MIPRERHLNRLKYLLSIFPVVAIIGARQVGKTTLARELSRTWQGPSRRFDLEDPGHLAQLEEPMLALGSLAGLVVIDEVQRRPELFSVLRVLVDRPHSKARFLVLGSASPSLLRQSSESLAGRIAVHELGGLSLEEVGVSAREPLWLRGGFPRSFLASNEGESAEWRREFNRTFLERDIPQLGIQIPSLTLHRFWRMLAHYHAQLWNGAELARAFGVAATTVRRYLDMLTSALVVRQLPAWHENISKRQVRSPKVYISDSGLLHSLLGIEDEAALHGHPKVGASWEGYALAEVIQRLGALPEECFFWGAHSGAKLDLLIVRGQKRIGIEFKRTTSPGTTRSMHSAAKILDLDELILVHAGEDSFLLRGGFKAVAFARLAQDLTPDI